MAHVALVDSDGIVRDINVISNSSLPNNGEFSEEVELAAQELQSRLGLTPDGSQWYLTSYNSSFRFRYAGLGMLFDQSIGTHGAFLPQKPYPSWIINHQTANWEPPIQKPDDQNQYEWAELRQEWVPTSAQLLPPVND